MNCRKMPPHPLEQVLARFYGGSPLSRMEQFTSMGQGGGLDGGHPKASRSQRGYVEVADARLVLRDGQRVLLPPGRGARTGTGTAGGTGEGRVPVVPGAGDVSAARLGGAGAVRD